MASILRIKRSSVSGNPGTLGAGELAYSALADNGSNGGERLYIGIGAETNGNAANHFVIGGTAFTKLLDHTPGTLTASSALIVDSNSKLDNIKVDNIDLNGNTVSTLDVNGNLVLNPNGTGMVRIADTWTLPRDAGTAGYALITNGSSAATWQAVSTSLTIAGDTGTDVVSLVSDTLTFTGGTGITSTVTNNAVDFSIDSTVATLTGTQTLTNKTLTLPTIGGTGARFSGSTSGTTTVIATAAAGTTTLTLPAATDTLVARATTDTLTNKSISGATNTLTNIGNAALTNSSVTVGSTAIALGASSTILAGLTTVTSSSFVGALTGNASTASTLQPGRTINNVGFDGSANITVTVPIASGVTGLGTGVATFLATPTSANLAAAVVTDKTGTGALVFATSPSLVTPTLGVATATTINKLTITAPATAATLTIANGKTFTVNNTLTFNGTDTSSVAFGTGGTVAYTANKLNVFAATTSAELAGVISDETGTGVLVFANTPTLVTPILGAATATSITGAVGNLAITAFAGNNNINLVPTGTGTVDVASKRITSLADPTQAQDAATKAYVDAVKTGLDIKDSVRATTTANITLSSTQTIDGVAVVVGNRVLVKDQTTALQNGIYVVAAGAWTRAGDFDNTPGVEVTGGAFTFVEEGTVNANNGFVLTTNGTITVGTTDLTFAQFSGAGQVVAGAGLTKTGNTVDAIGTTNRITVNADSIDIASTYVGQTSITTLGTIDTGTWQGTIVGPTYGGTGVNNGSRTITLGGNLTTSGAFTTTLTATDNTSVTLPTTGILATLAGTETLTNKTITGAIISTGSINNTPIGATTRNSGAFTTLTANGATTLTAGTSSTSSTSGTLVVTGGVGISQNLYGSGASTSILSGFDIDGGTY